VRSASLGDILIDMRLCLELAIILVILMVR